MRQAALFPMDVMNVTQRYGAGTSTHRFGFAIDIAGPDAGISQAHAPFDCKVVYRYAPNDWNLGHTVWFESVAPVRYADGTEDYAVVSMTHDNDVSDLPVGKTFSQGLKIYDEGTAGRASGNHIHLECGRGRFSGTGWKNINGEWVINNPYPPEKMLALFGTDVRNGGGLNWIRFKKEIDTMNRQTYDKMKVLGAFNFGNDFDYNEDLSVDQALDISIGNLPRITKEVESKVADGITGIRNVIGKDYNSQFVGKTVNEAYAEMVDFWIGESKGLAKPAPPSDAEKKLSTLRGALKDVMTD